MFSEVAEIALVAARLGQFQQLPKTQVILILNFTRPHAITYTYYIQLESVATSYPHGKFITMSCSISTLIGSECGTTSSKLNITQETIPISLCNKDVNKHLHTTSVTDISTEYDLILTRAGVFEYDGEYISRTTVCPKHRYQLGGGWFQKKVCRYPDHTGKAKPDRTINKLQSKIILDELKNLVPVGSGKITLFVQM